MQEFKNIYNYDKDIWTMYTTGLLAPNKQGSCIIVPPIKLCTSNLLHLFIQSMHGFMLYKNSSHGPCFP